MMKIAHSQIVRHTALESSYIPVALRRTILEEQNYTCYFCEKNKIKSLCHDLPKCRGGETELSNLVVCCTTCRRQKEELTTKEYLDHIKLDEENVFEEMTMFLRIYFLDGEIMEGEVPTLPGKNDKGFYFHPGGNGETIWVNLAVIKKFEIKHARNKEN